MTDVRRLPDLLAEGAIAPLVVDVVGDPSGVLVADVEHDSRRPVDGSIFCCVPGARHDGHDHARGAVEAGAVALLVERRLEVDAVQIVVPSVRRAMGEIAAAVHGHPSRRLRLIGITGTNGKTTTTTLLASVLEYAGARCATIGTLDGGFTTPEATDLQRRLARLVDDGFTSVVMEVSSHALEFARVAGCEFDLAIFTNLSRDHLDLHGTMERYFAVKAQLFTAGYARRGLANLDDTHGRLLVDAAPIPMSGFGSGDISDIVVRPTVHEYTWREHRVVVPMGGDYNVSNSLAVATASVMLGIEVEVVVEALAVAPAVPGRFEPVRAGQAFDVIVDYAHTPDGLRGVLGSVRSAMRSGRTIVVFGCGGDRDREKRPMMGEAAAELADIVVVTSDNPRSERSEDIIDAIVGGVPDDYRQRVLIEPDRRRAIELAFSLAGAGDVVVLAGKGHETTQTFADRVVPFDDRLVAREVLEAQR